MIVIKVPSGREVAIDERCFGSVGRCSNPNHYTVNMVCPQRRRWTGTRPASGPKLKKDGYLGRKIKPPKSLVVFDTNEIIRKTRETANLFPLL